MSGASLLSTAQRRTDEFLTRSEWLLQVTDDEEDRRLFFVTDTFRNAVAQFGLAEIYARQCDRCNALGLYPERASFAAAASQRHNDRGLELLRESRRGVADFLSHLDDYPAVPDLGQELDQFQDAVREQLVDLEVKGSDVSRINEEIERCFGTVRKEGLEGLGTYLDDRLGELEDVRQGEDRGARENIPIWKAIAVAVIIGVSLWWLFKCRWRIFRGWSCSVREERAYGMIGLIASLIAAYC